MSEPPPKRGQATESVHAGELRQQEANAITTPIYQTSTFWFKDSQELIDYQEGRSAREEYGRYGNPTWRSVELKLSALEGGKETILFAIMGRWALSSRALMTWRRSIRSAGFQWRAAGCSMCLAMNPDKLIGREVCASSSNRNFKGRQGSPTGRTLLMSPAMVAAAALRGAVADVREML